MQIEGKLIKILEAEAGTSKSGKAWSKQSCIVETDNKYNNQVCITAFGEEKINDLNKLQVGSRCEIWCNVYSREYNGKYYTQIDGWRFAKTTLPNIENEEQELIDNDLPF